MSKTKQVFLIAVLSLAANAVVSFALVAPHRTSSLLTSPPPSRRGKCALQSNTFLASSYYGGRERGSYSSDYGDYGYGGGSRNRSYGLGGGYGRGGYGYYDSYDGGDEYDYDDYATPREFAPHERAKMERRRRYRSGEGWGSFFGGSRDSYGGDYFRRESGYGRYGGYGSGYGAGYGRERGYYPDYGMGRGRYGRAIGDFDDYGDGGYGGRYGRGDYRRSYYGGERRGYDDRGLSFYDNGEYPTYYSDRRRSSNWRRGASEWGNLVGGAVRHSYSNIFKRRRRY